MSKQNNTKKDVKKRGQYLKRSALNTKRFSINMPENVFMEIRREAYESDCTLNRVVVTILYEHFRKEGSVWSMD